MKLGRPENADTGMGPLISQEHKSKVLSYYAKAAEEGATVVTGGGVPDMPGELKDGAWVQPTIWTGLPESASRGARGDLRPLLPHPALRQRRSRSSRWANDTSYGLAASVWTSNLQRGHRVAAAVEVGLVWVNSWFLRDLRTPFGGAKQSGIGREGGVHSLEFYTELKNVCIKL